MEDLNHRVQFQQLLLNIPQALKTTEETDLDIIIQSSLQKIAVFDHDEYCSINLIFDDKKTVTRNFDWFSETSLKLHTPYLRVSAEQLTGEVPVTLFDLSAVTEITFSEIFLSATGISVTSADLIDGRYPSDRIYRDRLC